MARIEKRGDSYRITVSAGYDGTGKQIRKTKTWKPEPGMTARQIEKELDRQAVLFETRVSSGQYFGGDIRLRDFIDLWFSDYAEGHLRARTLAWYRQIAERVYVALGHIRLDQLQPQHLIRFYKQLEDMKKVCGYCAKPECQKQILQIAPNQKEASALCSVSAHVLRNIKQGGNISPTSAQKIANALKAPIETLFEQVRSDECLSGKTVKNYHTFLSSVLDRAVKWQLIETNPCRRIDTPKAPRKGINCMDEKQIAQFISCLQEEPLQYQVIFLLLILTGMRRGELLGLEWPDVDFDKAIIHIRRTSQYTAAKGVFTDTTKTEQSKRPLAIPLELVELLRKYRAEQSQQRLQLGDRWAAEWSTAPRLFTQWDGRPMYPNSPYKEMQKILRRNGMPAFSLHSLRHTNATLLIGAGTDVRTVSGRLGHSQTSTTMNIYAEYLQSANTAASETLADALIRQKSG